MNDLRLRTRRLKLADEGVRDCLAQLRQYGFIRGHGGGCLPAEEKRIFVETLQASAMQYRAAGLGLLARRVAWLARQPDAGAAWAKFDRLNAGGCGVA